MNKRFRDHLDEWAAEFDKRRGIQPKQKIDRFCVVGRHGECGAGDCECACHKKDKMTPLTDLINPALFR